MILSTLALLLLFLLLFHVYIRNNRKGRLYSKIPGPPPYPIIGNIPLFLTNDMHYLWTLTREFHKKYYPIMVTYGIHNSFVHIQHPDDLEIVLTSQKALEKGYAYYFLEPWLKTGLLTSSDEKWKQRRRVLTPAFHFGMLKKYMTIIDEHGEIIIDTLKNEGDVVIKSLMPFCSNYTLNVICEATLDVSLNRMDVGIVSRYREAIHNMGKVLTYRLVRPHIPNCILPIVSKMGILQINALKILHEFTAKIIGERKQYHESTDNKYLMEYDEKVEENIYSDNELGRKKRLAMLDLLLAAEKKGLIDTEGIQEEVDTFTFEGHDTSGMAMAYTLMLLAENKEAQERARAEVMEVMDNGENKKIGISEIQELNYLERCIKEALRLYPSVSTIMRISEHDLQLKHALVPANTNIMIHFWNTHRDPNFWPDPDKFDPDRFLPENSKNRHPFSYVPFSAGPRNCIGQKFAMMELKVLIGRLLRDFYLVPVDRTSEMRLTADMILRPENPIHVKFVRIKNYQ